MTSLRSPHRTICFRLGVAAAFALAAGAWVWLLPETRGRALEEAGPAAR